MGHLIYKAVSLTVSLLVLFILSVGMFYYFSGFHKKIFFNEHNISIKELSFYDYFYIDKFNADSYTLKDNRFSSKSLNASNIHIYTGTDSVNSKDGLKLPQNLFLIINEILSYVNIYEISEIEIKNLFVDKTKVIKNISKHGDKIKVSLPDGIDLNFIMLTNNSFDLLLDGGVKVNIVLEESYANVKVFVNDIFLLSGKLRISDVLDLSDVKLNSEYFNMNNVFNDIKIYDVDNIKNDYFSFDGKTASLTIPWIGKENYNAFNTSFTYDVESGDLIGLINDLRLGNEKYKNVNIKFNSKSLKTYFYASEDKFFDGQFFISENGEYYINVDKLSFDKLKLEKEEFYILKHGISNSIFNILFEKNNLNIIFKKQMDEFVSKNYPIVFDTLKQYLKIESFVDLNASITLENDGLTFLLQHDNSVLSGKKTIDGISFSLYTNEVFLDKKMKFENISVNGVYRIKNNIIEINDINSYLKYKKIKIPVFSHYTSFYDLNTNELSISNVNNNFYLQYKNDKFEFFSKQPYIFKHAEMGKIKFDDIKISFANNKLNGQLVLGNSDIVVTKKILDLLTKSTRADKKMFGETHKKINKSDELIYKIHILSHKYDEKKITYVDKNAEIFLEEIDVMFSNEYLGGEVVIKEGNFDFHEKRYNLKKSNINIIDNRLIIGMNAYYEDDNIKANIGVFGNSDNNNLFVNLTSEPAYSESAIISYLLFNSELDDDGNTVKGDMINVGIDSLKNYLNIPIDSIKILERDTGDDAYQVSKNLSDKIKVQYTKETDSDDFEIIYKINKSWNLNSYTNERSNGVKVEWDYEY